MKIMLVAKPWRGGLADYLLHALRDVVGPEQVTYLPTRPIHLTDRIRAKHDKRYWPQTLLRTLETTPYDLAIFLSPLPIFAQLNTPQKHACWLVDDGRIAPELAQAMGHVFLSDPGYQTTLEAALPAGHFAGILPFAMLPAMHAPAANRTPNRAMCFIANSDAKRNAWLEKIHASGMDCHTYGNYFLNHPHFWKHPLRYHRAVKRDAMQSVYARYHSSLNIHANVVREGTNMRSFEAAGYGIAQLVEHRPGIEQLFDPVTELPTFTDIVTLHAQYDRLLNDTHYAANLAKQARARVLHEHSYQHRVRSILARI